MTIPITAIEIGTRFFRFIAIEANTGHARRIKRRGGLMRTDEKRTTDAKTLGRRWFEDVWTQRRDDLIDELMAETSYGHVEGGEVTGPADFRKMRDMFLS